VFALTIPDEDDTAGIRAVQHARQHFKGLRDPRRRRGKRHRLVDVVLISLLAMLCGCDDADDIADWAELRSDLLARWFDLKHGTPSQDTVLRVFEVLAPSAFGAAVMSWVTSLRPKLVGQVAIDGKTLRGSHNRPRGQNAIHVVTAWLREAGVVLAHVKTNDKSNEITAIPELLQRIDISGCVVTVDAGGCHRSIAAQVRTQKGQYLLAVKDNQPTLRRDLERLFAESRSTRRRSVDELPRPRCVHAAHTDGGHGRIEERAVWLTTDLAWLTTRDEWPELRGAAMVKTQRTDKSTGKTARERRYYITSDETLTAARVLKLTRGHWSIENELHWVLDVVFGEDASRIRARRAAENFGILRRITLSLLKGAPMEKKRMSIKHRRRHCDYRPEILVQTLLGGATASVAPHANDTP